MQLRSLLVAACVAAFGSPVLADCGIGVSTAGLLRLSGSDSHVLSSEAGTAAVLVVTNLSSLLGTTVTLSAPRLDSWPAGFAAGSALVESAYSATWLLGTSGDDSFSSAQRSFAVGVGAVVTLVLESRVTSPSGFRQGSYGTRTTVSCS